MPDEYDPKEKRDAIVDILNRYEKSDQWTREVTIDALRYIKAKYTLDLDSDQIVRGYRNYENVQYCPFCGSSDVEFVGWFPFDDPDRPDDKMFDCDGCGGFHLHADVTGLEKSVHLPEPLRESPSERFSPQAPEW